MFEQDGVVVALVFGEIDMATVGQVRAALLEEVHRFPRALVIDLGPVTFFASSGVEMLVALREEAAANQVRLAVVAANRAVNGILDVMGMRQVLDVYQSRVEAIAAAAG
ncbi:STAS domain-containing protein [Lentzea sp. JNUCC 0626]|uniref:STAS domain-containing protein n=1 Tax=Lentzea sp. JNUCC 0626 TaxID=3367513 RepID=UPI003748F822